MNRRTWMTRVAQVATGAAVAAGVVRKPQALKVARRAPSPDSFDSWRRAQVLTGTEVLRRQRQFDYGLGFRLDKDFNVVGVVGDTINVKLPARYRTR